MKLAFNKIKWSLHYEGYRATCLKMLNKTFQALYLNMPMEEKAKIWIEQRFDKRFHVDTFGKIDVEKLDISEVEKEEAVEYISTPSTFGFIMSSLKIDYQTNVFIDYGCGKGKVLFMASEFPFKKIMGVEISRQLCDSAEKNISSFQNQSQVCHDLSIECADAKSFVLPEEPLVLYFYNPFSEVIMKEVLDSISNSLKKTPRSILLIYYNPQHQELIKNSKQFKTIHIAGFKDPYWAFFQSDIS